MSASGLTIGEILSHSAARFPGKTALVCGTRRATYRELEETANRLAGGLAACGARRSTKVALLCRNSIEFVAWHFAVAKSGATLVPVNYLLAPRELVFVLAHSEAAIIVVSEEFAATMAAIRNEIPARLVLSTAAADFGREPGAEVLEVGVDEDDEYTLMYTSGTTGKPKGVVSTHRARVQMAVQGVIDYGMTHDSVTLLPVPLFHMGGLNTCCMANVLAGATVVLLPKFDVREALGAIERERVNFAFLAPTPLRALVESRELSRFDLSSLRYCMYGGAGMSPALIECAMERLPGVGFIQGYGSTEAGQLTVVKPEEHPRYAASAGRPCMLSRVRVVDPRGGDVAPGEVGEIATRGPNVMKEYYKAPAETAAAFCGGWLRTGDLARVDEEGVITIVDRATDMIISGSENVSPREVEEVLGLHPAVEEAAVFGVPDEHWGEAVCAAVVLKPGLHASAEELVAHCKVHLASYKKPRAIRFVDALPRTSIGKVAKARLRSAMNPAKPAAPSKEA